MTSLRLSARAPNAQVIRHFPTAGIVTHGFRELQATELIAGSDSAATEHTEEPQLKELVNQEAGLSSEIELMVVRSEIVDYTYPFNGNQVPTQKLQIILQSKIAEQYCLGVAKLQKKDKTELKAMADRWQVGTTWRFEAVPLLNVDIYTCFNRN